MVGIQSPQGDCPSLRDAPNTRFWSRLETTDPFRGSLAGGHTLVSFPTPHAEKSKCRLTTLQITCGRLLTRRAAAGCYRSPKRAQSCPGAQTLYSLPTLAPRQVHLLVRQRPSRARASA